VWTEPAAGRKRAEMENATAVAREKTKPRDLRGFPRADDGTRTHDLLHGNRTVAQAAIGSNTHA